MNHYPCTLSSHTIDLRGIPERPYVLDVGCRGFDFTEGILNIRPKARVKALDPDPEIEDPQLEGVEFRHVALVGREPMQRKYCSFSNGDGNFLGNTPVPLSKMLDVFCIDIREMVTGPDQEPWDIVKLDCEGSEFEILENWPGPIAKQISVEFHDYKSSEIHDVNYFCWLFERLYRFGYEVLQHPYSQVGSAWGHWDTLLRLRK